MLRISKLADYATIIMSYLAANAIAQNTAQITAGTGVPLPTARKLLKLLAVAKLVIASRGADGGYQLAREAFKINLGEIIEAIDGPLALTECCAPTPVCTQTASCHTKNHWQLINKVVRDALYHVSLNKMEQQSNEVAVAIPKFSTSPSRG